MKKFFRYSVSGLLGWMGYGFVFFGLVFIVITLFRQEFRWENSIIFIFGLALIYTCYSQGRNERFDVSVKGNELDDQIYKWIVMNGLASMEDLKKLDPPSASILDCDDLKRIKRETKK